MTALHPDFTGARRAARCAPVLTNGEAVQAVRAALRDRAIALGFSQTEAINVTATTGTRFLENLASDAGMLRLSIPEDTRQVTLHSACGVPAETGIDPDDRRLLGIKIGTMDLISNGTCMALDLGTVDGLYPADQGIGRWSGATIQVPLPATFNDTVLEISLLAVAARWEHPAIRRRTAG